MTGPGHALHFLCSGLESQNRNARLEPAVTILDGRDGAASLWLCDWSFVTVMDAGDSDFDEEELRLALEESQRLSQPHVAVDGRERSAAEAADAHVRCCECRQDLLASRARFFDFFDDGGEYVCHLCWPQYVASRVEMGFNVPSDAPFDLGSNAVPAVITLDEDDDARTCMARRLCGSA